jgi:phosphate starvation-inducible protein PhoH and related proteins
LFIVRTALDFADHEKERRLTAKEKLKTSQPIRAGAASDMAQIVLTFDNNKHATALFGQFDENLAQIEKKLSVVARSRGNELFIEGDPSATEKASRAIEALYTMIRAGRSIDGSDVDGAIRMTLAADDQPMLPTLERKSRLSVAHISTRKRTIQARTPTQDVYMRALERSEMVFGVGPAGTGKTYLAVAHAAMLLERGAVERIILSRPAVEAGERLGFLPGDLKEKVDPYLRPLYDALYDMMPADKVDRAITAGVIEIAPLAFMRGRTLAHAAVILDEAQNTTTMQMKMFLTRLGDGSRMIITGDPSQIDLPMGQKSGLVEALEVLHEVPGIVTVRFTQKDVVRHPLVGEIVDAYDKATTQTQADRPRSRQYEAAPRT